MSEISEIFIVHSAFCIVHFQLNEIYTKFARGA